MTGKQEPQGMRWRAPASTERVARAVLVTLIAASVLIPTISGVALLFTGQGPAQTLETASCALLLADIAMHSRMVVIATWSAAVGTVLLFLLMAGEDRSKWRAALAAGTVTLFCICLIMNDLRRVTNHVEDLARAESVDGATCPEALLEWYMRRGAALQRVIGADP